MHARQRRHRRRSATLDITREAGRLSFRRTVERTSPQRLLWPLAKCFHRRHDRRRRAAVAPGLRAIPGRGAGARLSDARRPLFLASGAAMFVFGITLAALGALFGLPETRGRLHVDLAQQGDIFMLLYAGVFVSTIIVGPIIDSFGNKTVLTTS